MTLLNRVHILKLFFETFISRATLAAYTSFLIILSNIFTDIKETTAIIIEVVAIPIIT